MRGLQRRRIIDAVSGHRHHLAVGLERFDQAQLLLRHDAGEDLDFPDPAAQFARIEDFQFRPGQYGFMPDADPARDGLRRARIIAGDHDHADTRPAGIQDRFRHFRTRRISEADQTYESEVDIVLSYRPVVGSQRRACDAEHAQAGVGHPAGGGHHFAQSCGIEMAEIGHRLGRPLGRHHPLAATGFIVGLPDMGHGQEIGRKAVLVRHSPLTMKMFRAA